MNRSHTFRRWALVLCLTCLASVAVSAFDVGDEVEVLWSGSWFEAEIVTIGDGRFNVHYSGWDSSYDEWMPQLAIRYPDGIDPHAEVFNSTGAHDTGMVVQVVCGDSWWDAVVVEVRDSRYLIRYDGYDASYDEWVGDDRIRVPVVESDAPIPFRPSEHYSYKLGDHIQIQSAGSTNWYEGEIIEIAGDRYRVRFDGYDDTTAEWATSSRIRTPEEGAIWDGLMYRFWYDVGTDGTTGYLSEADRTEGNLAPIVQSRRPSRAVGHFSEIKIMKREVPFARIDDDGTVSVGGQTLGTLARREDGIEIRRFGRIVGMIHEDGSVAPTTVAGWPEEASGVVVGSDCGVRWNGRVVVELDTRMSRINIGGGEWGYFESPRSPRDLRATAAFLLFFTELPHAMLRLDSY